MDHTRAKQRYQAFPNLDTSDELRVRFVHGAVMQTSFVLDELAEELGVEQEDLEVLPSDEHFGAKVLCEGDVVAIGTMSDEHADARLNIDFV